MTEAQVRKLVRKQISRAIKDDLEGGETLMKEVYERMDTGQNMEVCYDEMRRIVGWLDNK